MRKRVISMLIALAITAGLIPAMPVFAEEEAVLLRAERAGIEGLSPDVSYFTMGNAQTVVDEHGRYILTVYRDGNVSEEASVDIKTVDVSAVYGKDYVIDDDRYQTVQTETTGTIIERFGDDGYIEATKESLRQMQETAEGLEEAANNPEAESENTEPVEKSSLAAMKEAQTGEETRDTYDTEDNFVLPEIPAAGFDVGEEVEGSSITTINFAPDETEKQIIFKILDDDVSEGQEMINFMLTNPVNAAVTEPFTTTIVIEDDEPVVHPKISFTDPVYNAQDGKVKITLKRSEPLYSYVTAAVRSTDGTAKAGKNFDAVNGKVQFLPYRDETSFEIAVTPSADETSFTLELYGLLGGDEGEIVKTEVKINGGGALHDDNGESDAALMAKTETINIGSNKYTVDYSANSNVGRIYDETNQQETIGYYYKPVSMTTGKTGGNDTPSYFNSEYKDGKLRLRWYSHLFWDRGYAYAFEKYDATKWQSIWADYETLSTYNSSKCGMFTTVNNYYKESAVRNKVSRGIRGHITLTVPGKNKNKDLVPASGTAELKVFAERTNNYCVSPEAYFYGTIYLNREFDIKTVSADKLKFKTAAGSTVEKPPGIITSNKQKVYREGTVTFSDYASSGEPQKWGQLIGYDIKCGSGSDAKTLKIRPAELGKTAALKDKYGKDCYYAPTDILSADRMTLKFDYDLIKEIDSKTTKVNTTGIGYKTVLEVKPVFEHIPIKVDVIKADNNMGEFKSEYLKKSSTDKLFVGDEINMDAQPAKNTMFYHHYAFKGYANPGDTQSIESSAATNYEENKNIVLKYRKYEFKPLFEDTENHIQVILDDETSKYFTVANTTTSDAQGLKGKTLLVTDGKDKTKPIAGKAYKIELVPKSGVTLPNNKRPRITNTYNPDMYVDGYGMNILANAEYSQNIYKVTMKEFSGEYRYFSLSGVALYSSVGLLDGTAPLTDEPAKQNSVSAGWWLVKGTSSSGDSILRPEKRGELTDENGKYEVSGIRAVPGDKISVLVTNNNIDQVVYPVLKADDKSRTADKTFTELTDSDTNRYSTVTKKCVIVDMNTISMPIRTAYAPYIQNITLEYGKSRIPGGTTSVEIRENDVFMPTARVETNKTDVKCVQFILYNRKGVSKGNVTPIYEDSGASKKDNSSSYIYDTGKPDANGYCRASIPSGELEDGDMLYVRVISNRKNAAGDYITYPILNVGVRFFTPIKTPVRQEMQVNISGMGNLQLLGDLAADFDSGNLMWKTTYADSKNPGTSPYITTIGISADGLSIDKEKGKDAELNWGNMKEFDKYRKGESSKEKKSNEEVVNEMKAKFDPNNVVNTMDANLQKSYSEEIAKLGPNATDAQKKDAAQKLFEKDAYKKNLNNLSKKWNFTFSAKIMLQFLYTYNKEKQEHVFVGGEYLVAVSAKVKKTTYWVIMGVPVFLNFNGGASVQVDGAWISGGKSAALTAKEIGEEENILNLRFKNKNAVPWMQIGANAKISVGAGYCGVADITLGYLKLSLVTRFTFTSNRQTTGSGKDSWGGFMVDFSGGVGFSALVVKVEYQIGRVKQGWGVFDTNGPLLEGGKLADAGSDNGLEMKASIVPFSRGNEHTPQNSDASLSSVLKRDGEMNNIVEDTMEYISPKAVNINDNNDTFIVYLADNGGEDTANASTLKYMIRDGATGQLLANPEEVNPDGIEDTTPDILYVPSEGKVYVAWSSASKKLSNITGEASENLEKTKENLKLLNIYMRVYDVNTKTWSDVISVAEDNYENSHVKLTSEGGKIAIRYYKRYVDNIKEIDDILSPTLNYNTWAKKLYNPANNDFEILGQYAKDDDLGHKKGDNYKEKLLSFSHPDFTKNDPIVSDLVSQTYTYKYGEDEPIEYSLDAYTVDKDGDIQSSSEREVWLKITNITKNKEYYPIKLDGGNNSISSPRLTKVNGDLLITWLTDTSYFNMISVKETLDTLRTERPASYDGETLTESVPDFNESSLCIFNNIPSDAAKQKDWYKSDAVTGEIGNNNGLAAHICNDEFPIITKDFGENEVDNPLRHEANLSNYQIIVGGDNNVYLFWTEPSDDFNNLGNVLYASSFYRVGNEWLKKYGTLQTGIEDLKEDENDDYTWIDKEKYKNNITGFSDAVKIMEEQDLVINEMSAVVTGDSSALLLANTYKETIESDEYKYGVNPITDGPHNLTEIKFKPYSSLEVVDNEITMTDENPKPGEEILFSWKLRNNGLLPTYGNSCKIEVYDSNNSLLYSEESTKSGKPEAIYVSDILEYTTDIPWIVPDDIGDVKVVLTVEELDEKGRVIPEPLVLERNIKKSPYIQCRNPEPVKYSEVMEDIDNETELRLTGLSASSEDSEEKSAEFFVQFLKTFYEVVKDNYPELIDLSNNIDNDNIEHHDKLFDYLVYIPVRNIGNEDVEITADIKLVDQEFNITDQILGKSSGSVNLEAISPDSDEYSYIVVPIDIKPEQYNEFGVILGSVDIYADNKPVIENLDLRIFETENSELEITNADGSITLKKGDTFNIETVAYPFDSEKSLKFESSDVNVATVSNDGVLSGIPEGDSKKARTDGVITAVGAGTAKITVTELSSGKTREISVTVTDSGETEPKPTNKHKHSGGDSSSSSTGAETNTDSVKYNSSVKNGKISVSDTNAKPGDSVTITVTPDEGYEAGKVSVTDEAGNEIKVSKREDGTYWYIQPDGAVTVDAVFVKKGENGTGDKVEWWFKDVPESSWYYTPIKEAYDNSRMEGMSEDYFEPETDITRGMFAYSIYRREGLPETDSENKFDDVKNGSYYEKAIAWATQNGIVAGYDDTHYGPDDSITREQMAAILWRYAQYKNADTSVGEDTNILDYTDAQSISGYAAAAIRYACGAGIITGFEDKTLRPQNNANRAQMAVILNKIADIIK